MSKTFAFCMMDVVSLWHGRCDRIIYKTTVVPPPDDDEPQPEIDDRMLGSRGRRVGLAIVDAIFHRSQRPPSSGRDSLGGLPRTESMPEPVDTINGPESRRTLGRPPKSFPLGRAAPSAPPVQAETVVPIPRAKRSSSLPHVHPPNRRPQSASSDTDGRMRSTSTSGTISDKPTVSPIITSLSPSGLPSLGTPSSSQPSSTIVSSPITKESPTSNNPASNTRRLPGRRWYQFPSVLLMPNANANSAPTAVAPPSPQQKRRKIGDVECLHYGTLDDQGMAKLRGRSDHRPVIGVYSIVVA